MKLAIMQPYFFPYLGYFSLINQSDEIVLFDTPQFMRKGWIERNRIGKLTGGSVYIKVPLVKSDLNTSIKDMKIDNRTDWRNKILSQLDIYRKKAPYYKKVKSLVEAAIEQEFDSIVKLNEQALKLVCEYLNIDTKISVFSELNLTIDTPKAADEWALNICQAMGVKHYVNAPGGQSFFDTKKYSDKDVSLHFVEQPLDIYEQLSSEFEPGLSIIDVMMFNSPDDINRMLSKGSLIQN
ncbi:WbqC family protein [Shewanella glacialipiscicola]|uniref:WbqC family protein n=1 Tax=Shewanella glacialipiscicola TaxID=614069 RepID=UPI0021D9C921|nr:WbqC family protein [Shewanella glacialipiscicola]MCU7995611.1 WbqC family protein [Shewanella glacialipiscicola]MCU8026858.1 WbqC family protein [Shewanella glacialipiscicola]